MLRINEIFHSIQGESTHAGRPCVFVRLTGCNLRCRWCDTTYAFHEGRDMTPEQICEQVAGFDCPLVEITGGEPLLQKGVIPLMESLLARGHEVLLETGGSLDIATVPAGVRRVVDVKCPGSGEDGRNRWENLALLRAGDELKFVIADRRDYEWARAVIGREDVTAKCSLLFSAVEGELSPGMLAEWVLADRLPVRLQLQMHKILWPEARRGF